jgi:hypothetical protein
MRALVLAIGLSLALTGCSYKKRVKHLSDEEFTHWYALRVFMNEGERKTYLKLKTEEERNEWLQVNGYWDHFYQYEPHIRQLIIDGSVQRGWTKEMVYMAWGHPIDKRRLPGRQATRSEMLMYKFERHADGGVMLWEPASKTAYGAVGFFRREVILDDDVVAEVIDR